MSFLHKDSCLGVLSQLDIFAVPTSETSLDRSNWIEYKPISSLTDDGAIEFVISGTTSEYIDLSETLLYIKCQIVKNNNDLPVEADKIAPVNNFLHSLFSQVDVYLNGKLITPSNNTYAYRAYLENLLNYGKEAKESYLSSSVWFEDSAGEFDTLDVANKGYISRRELTKGGKQFDMIGRLHSDIFNQERYLISDVEVRIKLVRSKNSFSLMTATGLNPKVHLLDTSLVVRKVKINPAILLAHAKGLELSTAKYPITKIDTRTITIPSGLQSKSLDNIFLGQLPKRLVIGFVKNISYNGHYEKNPFNFENFKLNYFSLTIDGDQIHGKPLQPDFDYDNYIHAFHTLFSGTGMHHSYSGNGITRTSYPDGNFILAFDLTNDLSASCSNHWSLQKSGSVRIEVGFAEALPCTINCIIYSEFQNLIQISREREIITDF